MLTIVVLLASQLVYVYGEYVVPQPHFKVLEPQGFRVSIPHEDGVQLFAFHANINKPMDGLEAGQISKDILKSKQGKWVFTDHQTKLKKGDVIFYWLFVIKNHLGYRRDNGEYRVDDITNTSPEGSQESNFHASTALCPTQFHPNTDIGYKIALKVSDMAGDLYEEVKKLREINSILKELVKKNERMAIELKFEGVTPAFEDAQYAAQMIINEKIRLNVPVINATRNEDKSISFEVSTLDDKIYLIRTAKVALKDSKIKLVY